MKLQFANTDKKRNSTAIVSSYSITKEGSQFKEESSMTRPIFMIGTDTLTYTGYNYLKVTFENNAVKYYFIDSFELDTNNCWYIHCTMDVLATYKSSILAKELYVLRNANTYDAKVPDSAYPMLNYSTGAEYKTSGGPSVQVVDDYDGTSVTDNNYFNKTYINGWYYVKVVSDTSVTGVRIYIMSPENFANFIASIFTIDYTSEFGDIATGVARGIANIFQFIVEAYWLPVKPSHLSLNTNNIKIGTYSISGIAHYDALPSDSVHINFSTPIGHHPQISRGNYLDNNPFTRRKLVFYPFGVYEIDGGELYPSDENIDVSIHLDINTGESIITVKPHRETASVPVMIKDVQSYKVTIPLSESSISLIGGIGAGIKYGMTGGEQYSLDRLASSKSIGEGAVNTLGLIGQTLLANPLGAIGNAIAQSGTEINHTGTLSNFVPYKLVPSIIEIYNHIADEDIEHKGRPLCKNKTLSSLTGFTICGDNDIGLTDASQDQLDMIKEYLITGFFIEE